MNNGIRYILSISGILIIAYCFYIDMPYKKMFAIALVLWALEYLVKMLLGEPYPGYEFDDENNKT